MHTAERTCLQYWSCMRMGIWTGVSTAVYTARARLFSTIWGLIMNQGTPQYGSCMRMGIWTGVSTAVYTARARLFSTIWGLIKEMGNTRWASVKVRLCIQPGRSLVLPLPCEGWSVHSGGLGGRKLLRKSVLGKPFSMRALSLGFLGDTSWAFRGILLGNFG